jgi:hypothetical protein
MKRICKKLLRSFAGFLLPLVAELVVRGLIPGRIGRYIVLDTLLAVKEGQRIK